MTQQPPIDALLEGIRALFDATPTANDQLRGVIEGVFKQFQLVPKREFDGHLNALEQLEATVAQLEERIKELESQA